MKRFFLSVLMALPITLLPVSALAVDGTLTVSGNLVAQTCTIKGNGGSKDFSVALPAISASALQNGDWGSSGQTRFTIALSGCAPSSGKVRAYFNPDASSQMKNSGIVNKIGAGYAQGVVVGIKNADLSRVLLGNQAAADQGAAYVDVVAGSATLVYYATYFKVSMPVVPGLYSGSISYNIIYQ